MTQIRLRILGESIIEIGDSKLEPSATHLFALALYLSIERGKRIPRTLLADVLFPAITLPVATHNLRQLVYRLRRKGAPVESTSAAVSLPERSVTGAPETALSRSYLEAVSDASSCVLLPGYEPPTTEFSVWLENYRDSLTHKLQTRLARDLHRARQGADWGAVDQFARGLLGIDPLNETATLGLAESMARAGSKQKAIQLLRAYARDVGTADAHLALPSRFLTRRIAEETNAGPAATAAMIGRAEELRQLTGGWSHAKSGNCAISCVTGEKSIGKSRVLGELAALVRLEGSGTVLTFRPLAGDRDRPMSLLSDMCRRLLQLPGAAGCSPDTLPYIHRLIGTPNGRDDPVDSDSDAKVSEVLTRRALLDLLDSVCSEHPLLVCIDDADGVDRQSFELLSLLPELTPALPAFFLFASTLPEALPPRRRIVHLPPLAVEHSLRLANCLRTSGGAEVSDGALEWCVSVASGNPGHLELLLKHVIALRDTPTVPPSLIALVDEQLHSLAPAARHVLQACATFGSECRPEVITALTGLSGYELLSVLEALVLRGLVTDTQHGIACRSSLIAERVTCATAHAVRCLLNRRAAEHLEQRIRSDFASQAIAWRVADHWQAAGDRARALHWKRVCWQRLLSLGQPVAAAESIRTHITDSTSLEERARLLEILAETLRYASNTRAQLQVLEDRAALSDRIGDDAATRLALSADIAEARSLSFEDTSKVLPDLRALLRTPSLDDERRLRIARVLVVTADNMLSESLAREALSAVPDSPRTSSEISLGLQIRTIYHAVFGDRNLAGEFADLLLAHADKQDLSHAVVTSYLTATLAIRVVGERNADTALLPALYERCMAAGALGAAIRIAGRLGSMQHENGDLNEARAWCRRTTELLARTGTQRVSTDYLTLQVDLALADGSVSLARQLITEAPIKFPMYSSPKWSNAYDVYRTRVDQYEGRGPIPPDRIEALLNWHHTAKRFGRHDDHTEVLWSALRDAGRPKEASAMLRDYLLFARREVRPCIYLLSQRTAADAVWSEVRGRYASDRSPITAH